MNRERRNQIGWQDPTAWEAIRNVRQSSIIVTDYHALLQVHLARKGGE